MITHKLPAFTLTISSTAITLAAAIAAAAVADFSLPEGANRVVVQVETNDLRYLWDGNTPTGAVGLLANAGNGFIIDGDIGKLTMIRDGGSDVTLTVQVQTIYRGEH